MDGGGGVNAVEVIVVVELNLFGEITSHVELSVSSVPGSTVTASGVAVAVNKGLIVARRSNSVGTFHLHTFNKRSKEILGSLIRNSGSRSEDVTDEGAHLLGDKLVGISFSNLGFKIRLVNSTGRSTRHETHVGTTWDSDNGEHILLAGNNVLNLVVVAFGNTGHTEETILGTTKGENGRWEAELSLTRLSEVVVGAEDNRSHKNGTLDLGVVVSVVLGHDTTEGVSGKEDVVTFETSLLDFRNGLGNIVVDEKRLRNREQEGWKTNPDSLAIGSTLINVSLSNVGVSSVIAVGTVDPNNGDILTLGGGRWQNDSVCSSKP
mmetsp:Transcript_17501/g.24081  ORF Transcript_17501/g.24081 Transcript_17501/m.24081 type:complete len:321 (-) Transcript_17501:122-1084(-)